MNCTDPEIGKLISLYEFEQLSEGDRRKFDAHLLSCDYCFQNLYSLSPIVTRMREHPNKFLSVLAQQPSVWATMKLKIVAQFKKVIQEIARMPLPMRIAIPSAALATLLFILLIQPQPRLADLAQIEPLPYHPLRIKQGTTVDEADRLFNEGMQYYSSHDYSRAINKLMEAVSHQPQNPNFHFYLALSYLLTDQTDAAIPHLQRTIELRESSNSEIVYWYLANAWLLKGNKTEALQALEDVVAFDGEYAWRAKEIISDIEKLSDQ